MNLTRLKHLTLLAVGLLAAGPASAATLTVYSTMTGSQMPAGNALFAVGVVTGTTPSTINCPTNYTAAAANGVCVDAAATGTVTLTAASTQNATFLAWSGCTTAVGPVCTVDASSPRSVQASFKPALYPLTLKTYGSTGNPGVLTTDGLVTTPAANCGAGNTACAVTAANGATVVVTAVPGAGYKVVNWTGCTASTATSCDVALTSPKGISATFGPIGIPVTVQLANTGAAGTVTAPLGGAVIDAISCGADCSGQVNPGGSITLTAVAGSSSKFVGFTGCTTSTATTCTITNVTSPRNVTATFKGSNCLACHANPPADHAANGWAVLNECSACHGSGYTGGSVAAATHMNGTLNAVALPNPQIPTPMLARWTISRAAVVPSATNPLQNVAEIDLKVTDQAGAVIDIPAQIALGQRGAFGNNPASTSAASGLPRFSVGMVQDDGSFLPMLGTTTLTTSETGSNVAKWSDQGGGVYRYSTVATVGRPGYDASRVFRAVAYGATYYKWADGTSQQLPGADYIEFVPNGGAGVGGFANTVTAEACNACHGNVTLHGRRTNVAICLTCHNANAPLGSGNTDAFKWDLKNLVHKFHSGKNYGSWTLDPATGRAIISTIVQPTKPDGTTGSAWVSTAAWATNNLLSSAPTLDATGVLMAPSHSLYWEAGLAATGIAGSDAAVVDPELVMDCRICHQGPNADRAYTRPTRASCGSCHDGVNFATGVGHNGGIPQTSDAACTVCHPSAGAIVGTSIYPVQAVHGRFFEPAHKMDFAALTNFPTDGHKFNVTLLDVVAGTNGIPTFTVDVSLDNNPFNIRGILQTPSTTYGRVATCAFQIAGPTSDFVYPNTGGTAVSCTGYAGWTWVSDSATSSRFTFTQTSGTGWFVGKPVGYYTAAFEIMWQRVATATNGDFVKKPFSANPNFLTVQRSSDNSAAVVASPGTNARRAVVTFDKCNACHADLGFHSNRGRKGPDYCATCHNPKLDNGTRARAPVAAASTIPGTTQLGYLPESVSMNVFIHRIHMGADLPSVASAAAAGPYVPEPGAILYGATRSNFTGNTGTTAPSISDFSQFAMPNPMVNCAQCHIESGATKTWALNEGAGLAPVERTWRLCTPATVSWDTVQWCDATTTNSGGMPKYTGTGALVVTPPLKASCTSCHDGAATDVHADLYTVNPMTAGATETCASCHGAGKTWDSTVVHKPVY